MTETLKESRKTRQMYSLDDLCRMNSATLMGVVRDLQRELSTLKERPLSEFTTDELTGDLNRRGYEVSMRRAPPKVRRSRRPRMFPEIPDGDDDNDSLGASLGGGGSGRGLLPGERSIISS